MAWANRSRFRQLVDNEQNARFGNIRRKYRRAPSELSTSERYRLASEMLNERKRRDEQLKRDLISRGVKP